LAAIEMVSGVTMQKEGVMSAVIGHERLHVYARALEFVSWTHSTLTDIDKSVVVLDHWTRAAESIGENIANGNSRRSAADRNQYFDVAIGSALECAACLDICGCRKMITEEQKTKGKGILLQIVKMTIGLRKAQDTCVREDQEPYNAGQTGNTTFAHESLDVYQIALQLIAWSDKFLSTTEFSSTYAKRLDKGTTSLVLNIAEGNGRFSEADQMRFIDIAHTSAMRFASCLDVLAARRLVSPNQIEDGKRLLAKTVSLLLGLRGYLNKCKQQR
jgi:four helix bundle protein